MKKIKLLLADNHLIMMDGIQAFLERDPNMEVVGTVPNGEEALLFLEQNTVDVAILDINMPVLGGIETAKQLLKRFPKTKIILLTTYSERQFIRSALRLQIPGYVVKDKSKETLVAAIYAVMKGHRHYPVEVDLIEILTGPDVPSHRTEANLTKRELEIIALMRKHPEFTSREIAEHLFIAAVTVEKHQQNVKKKLGFTRNQEVILYAQEHNINPSQ